MASAAGVIFVVVVWRVIGRPVSWNSVQLGALPLALAVTGAVVFLAGRTWRFRMLFGERGRPLGVAGVTGVGWGAGLLLPGPSGDVAFVAAARRVLGVSIARASGAAVLARLFDLGSIALVAAVAALVSANSEPGGVMVLSVAIAAGAVLMLAAMLWRRPRGVLLGLAARVPRLGRLAERAEIAMAELSRPRPALGLAGSTAVCRVATAVQYAGLMSMVGLHLGFWQTWFALSIRTLLFTVPVQGIAGIGTSQAWWTSALVLEGLPLSAAVSASVTLQALDLAVSLPIAALCSLLTLRARVPAARRRAATGHADPPVAASFPKRAVPRPQQVDGG